MDRGQKMYLLHKLILLFTINFFIEISARVGKELYFQENEFVEGLIAQSIGL